MTTYFPSACSKNISPLRWSFCVNDTLVTPLARDLFRIACSRPWGAISSTTAFLWIWRDVSSNRTGDRRLLVWYSADEYLARLEFQLASGFEVESHLAERGLGLGITWKELGNDVGVKHIFLILVSTAVLNNGWVHVPEWLRISDQRQPSWETTSGRYYYNSNKNFWGMNNRLYNAVRRLRGCCSY